MLKMISKWFGERQMTIPEDEILQCRYESHTYNCELVEDLKMKQAEKKRLEQDIKEIPDVTDMEMPGIRKCLDVFKEHFGDTYGSRLMSRQFMDSYGFAGIVSVLNSVIIRMSDEDIDKIYIDLKKIRERSDMIHSKMDRANKLSAEITQIESKLGID